MLWTLDRSFSFPSHAWDFVRRPATYNGEKKTRKSFVDSFSARIALRAKHVNSMWTWEWAAWGQSNEANLLSQRQSTDILIDNNQIIYFFIVSKLHEAIFSGAASISDRIECEPFARRRMTIGSSWSGFGCAIVAPLQNFCWLWGICWNFPFKSKRVSGDINNNALCDANAQRSSSTLKKRPNVTSGCRWKSLTQQQRAERGRWSCCLSLKLLC